MPSSVGQDGVSQGGANHGWGAIPVSVASQSGQGALLVEDALDHYQPLGAHGQAVHLSYLQLRAAVRQRLGQRHANLFSRPVRDSKDKIMRWFAEFPGAPLRWYDLAPADQTQRALELHAMRAEFAGFIGQLRASEAAAGTGSKAFANVLEQALLVPDDRHLFFIGDQPILSFWGFRGLNGPAFEALSVAPPRAAASAQAVPVPADPLAPPRRSFWGWLRWLASLLALLGLILFGLYFCAPQLLAPAVQLGSSIGFLPKGHLTLPDGRMLLPDGRIVGSGTVGGPSLPGLSGISTVTPDAAAPVSHAPTPVGPGPQDKDTEQKPAVAPDQPQTPPSPEQTRGDVPPQPPLPTNPDAPPQDALQIPPDAVRTGNVRFMQGNWKSGKGLVDSRTGQPLQQFYRFDQSGNGQSVLRRGDGRECTAPAVARMDGGTLVVEETSDVACPDGQRFSRSKATCSVQGGKTICQGQNASGQDYRVGIEKAP